MYNNRSIVENKGAGSKNKFLPIHYSPKALMHVSFSEDVKKVSYVKNKSKMNVGVVTLESYYKINYFL